MSLSNYLENKLLDHIRGGTAFSQPAGIYMQLHLGDPGEDCTANPATVTTRQAVAFATAASLGSIPNTATVTFSAYSTAETVTYFSLWDASTAGNPLGSGSCGSHAMGVGDTLSFAIGAVTWTMD